MTGGGNPTEQITIVRLRVLPCRRGYRVRGLLGVVLVALLSCLFVRGFVLGGRRQGRESRFWMAALLRGRRQADGRLLFLAQLVDP